MAGSPSHSVRDIQEPPRSWVGVRNDPRGYPRGAPARPAARLICQARAIRRRDSPSNKRCARQNCRPGGKGPEAHRASVRLKRQVESELSVPPRTSLVGSSAASCDFTGGPCDEPAEKRLTYCFDSLRMRTLGSLPAVPETPVVRNARQLFLSDDRRHRSGRLNSRLRAPVAAIRIRILGAQGILRRRTRWQSRQRKLGRKSADAWRVDSRSDGRLARKLRLRSGPLERS